jgi:polyhydroxyalkanoate synthesis repressor PhaR
VIRVIKRYGSRKLYDTEESRYVSLEEIGDWVRAGQQIQVVDNQSGEDVTAHTLTQVILEEGRRGHGAFSADFLHDLIRRGERVVSSGVVSLQQGVDRLIQASVDRVGPLRQLRDETRELRERLEALEAQIAAVERAGDEGGAARPRPVPTAAQEPSRTPARATAHARKKGA